MKLKQFNFLFALLMAGFSTSQNIESSANGEAQLLLSGDWKFHTIFGVGSNYNTISKTADDIVIDNADVHNVVIKGDWELKTEGARESTFFNKDYLQRSFDKGESDRNYVRFTPNLPQAGFYEAFVQAPFASHLTAQAGVKHAQ